MITFHLTKKIFLIFYKFMLKLFKKMAIPEYIVATITSINILKRNISDAPIISKYAKNYLKVPLILKIHIK